MTRKQKLKVYRTPIGFHDAYVAATSQKEALKAWGSDVDLFSRGIAERVTEEALTREPLDRPGVVVRRPRGTNDEYMAALPKDAPPSGKRPPSRDDDAGPPPRRRNTTKAGHSAQHRHEAPPPAETRAPMKSRERPRPSRDRLDEAERAIELAQAEHEKRIADLRQRERDLQKERRAVEENHERDVIRLETALAKVRDRYSEALQKWRGG
jgi:hypothetical protein